MIRSAPPKNSGTSRLIPREADQECSRRRVAHASRHRSEACRFPPAFAPAAVEVSGSITNSTFQNAGNVGGGASLKGVILVGGATGRPSCSGAVTDAGYNISDDDSCAFTAVRSLNSTDPKLDPNGLQNNGGPTQTIALLSASPAMDAIPVADCTDEMSNPITTDQRGFPRPDAAEDACDIGAYEVEDLLPFARPHRKN